MSTTLRVRGTNVSGSTRRGRQLSHPGDLQRRTAGPQREDLGRVVRLPYYADGQWPIPFADEARPRV